MSKNMFQRAGLTLEQIKYEIAEQHGINLGANTASKYNGYVGGMMHKSLLHLGECQMKPKKQS